MTVTIFDPNDLNPAERAVVEATATGDWAMFLPRPEDPATQLDGEKPTIRAVFLRHLLLRLPILARGKKQEPWFVSPTGVRILGATVKGTLDLTDACGIDGACLPALTLEYCDIPEPIRMDHAEIGRLSLKGSRLRELSGHEMSIEGQLDLNYIKPMPVADHPEQCWVHLAGTRIDGDLECLFARFVAPPKRDPLPKDEVPNYAFNLRDADICGRINACHIEATGGVSIGGADIGGEVWFSSSTLRAGEGFAFRAQSTRLKSSLMLSRLPASDTPFSAEGVVWLLDAKIGGALSCSGGHFHNPSGDAIAASRIEIGDACLMGEGFEAKGCVWLLGAKIGGSLDCRGGIFRNPQGYAVIAQYADIGGACLMNYAFKAIGEVSLANTNIAGNLECQESLFANRHKWGFATAIEATRLQIGGNCILGFGFKAVGKVALSGAKIAGDLVCSQGTFLNRDSQGATYALEAKNTVIEGNCILGLNVKGAIDISGSRIAGNLTFPDAVFKKRSKTGTVSALSAENIELKGDCLLGPNIQVDGKVFMSGAKIGGNLKCNDGKITNFSKTISAHALIVENAEIGHDCRLERLTTSGYVSLMRTKIAGNLECRDTSMSNPNDQAFVADECDIGGNCLLFAKFVGQICIRRARIGNGFGVELSSSSPQWNLTDTTIGAIYEGGESPWGTDGTTITAEGLSYRRFDNLDTAYRISWLRTYFDPNATGVYSPLHYAQLAGVLRATGHSEAAREVLRHQQWVELGWKTRRLLGEKLWRKLQGASRPLGWLSRVLNALGVPFKFFVERAAAGLYALFGLGFAFGYSPARATATFLLFLAMGAFAVHWANNHALMTIDTTPVASAANKGQVGIPAFPFTINILPCGDEIQSTLYALDVAIPLIDLHQEDKCEFGSMDEAYETNWPVWLAWQWDVVAIWRWAKALYALIGALVTSLTLLTFTGILQRKDETP